MADLYMLTSPSGKNYIGISESARRRWVEHSSDARKGSKLALHSAINKYGWDNFKKQILVIGTYEYVKELEIKAIELYRTKLPYGYNMTSGGETSPMLNPEIASKVSKTLKGRKNPEHSRLVSGQNNPMFGKKHSLESKEIMRLKMLSRPEFKCLNCNNLFKITNLKAHIKACGVKS